MHQQLSPVFLKTMKKAIQNIDKQKQTMYLNSHLDRLAYENHK